MQHCLPDLAVGRQACVAILRNWLGCAERAESLFELSSLGETGSCYCCAPRLPSLALLRPLHSCRCSGTSRRVARTRHEWCCGKARCGGCAAHLVILRLHDACPPCGRCRHSSPGPVSASARRAVALAPQLRARAAERGEGRSCVLLLHPPCACLWWATWRVLAHCVVLRHPAECLWAARALRSLRRPERSWIGSSTNCTVSDPGTFV